MNMLIFNLKCENENVHACMHATKLLSFKSRHSNRACRRLFFLIRRETTLASLKQMTTFWQIQKGFNDLTDQRFHTPPPRGGAPNFHSILPGLNIVSRCAFASYMAFKSKTLQNWHLNYQNILWVDHHKMSPNTLEKAWENWDPTKLAKLSIDSTRLTIDTTFVHGVTSSGLHTNVSLSHLSAEEREHELSSPRAQK